MSFFLVMWFFVYIYFSTGHCSVAQNRALRFEMVTVGTKKNHLTSGHRKLNIFFTLSISEITQMHPDMGNEIQLNELWLQNMTVLSRSMPDEDRAVQG